MQLPGMPEPYRLEKVSSDGETVTLRGPYVVRRYEDDDIGLRNLVLVSLREAGHSGKDVAACFGLSVPYVSALRGRVKRSGLPELVRLEVLYAICCRVRDQIRTTTNVHPYLDHLRAAGVSSVLDFDLRHLGVDGDQNHVRFARYCVDRVRLVHAANESSFDEDVWDLRLFGHSGRKHLDFGPIRQRWLCEATKAWAADALVRVRAHETVKHRVQSIDVLSAILAAGPGGGDDPSALSRSDIDRFLMRVGTALSRATGRPYSESRTAGIVVDCALVIREAREMGLFPNLAATFSFRRHDGGHRPIEELPGRALPAHVIAQLDAQLDLLATMPGSPGDSRSRSLGVLGERAGEMAVLVYELSYGTACQVPRIACATTDSGRGGPKARRTAEPSSRRAPLRGDGCYVLPSPLSVVATWLRGLRDAPGRIGSTMSRQSRIRGPKPRMSAIRRTEPQTWNASARRRAVAKNWRGAFLPRRRPGASRRARSPAVETVDRPGKRRAEPHATISA